MGGSRDKPGAHRLISAILPLARETALTLMTTASAAGARAAVTCQRSPTTAVQLITAISTAGYPMMLHDTVIKRQFSCKHSRTQTRSLSRLYYIDSARTYSKLIRQGCGFIILTCQLRVLPTIQQAYRYRVAYIFEGIRLNNANNGSIPRRWLDSLPTSF